MFPEALVHRVDAVIAGIAHAKTSSADATQNHALQQAEAFSRRAGQPLTIGPVGGKSKPVGDESIPVGVAFVMIRYHHPPCILGHRTRAGGDLAGWPHLL